MCIYEKLQAARSIHKITSKMIIDNIISDFFECSGDRLGDDDKAIVGGIGRLEHHILTIIGINRPKDETSALYRYGMPMPSGYRKAYRLMKQAERFHRPILTLIDTPGAFPGVLAEDTTQAIAIAQNIALMSQLKVPIIAVVIGEGGSGGALALAVSDKLFMFEKSIYSVISPEACATILWKDKTRVSEAMASLKITSLELKSMGICDEIIAEDESFDYYNFRKILSESFDELKKIDEKNLLKQRYQKYRKVGQYAIR